MATKRNPKNTDQKQKKPPRRKKGLLADDAPVFDKAFSPNVMNAGVFDSAVWEADEFESLNETVDDMQRGVATVIARQKTRKITMVSQADFRKRIAPVNDLQMQYMLDCIGIREQTVIDLIGPEGVGKSTFLVWLLGQLGLMGCFSVYVECENKLMDGNRFLQILHPNKKVAERLFGMVTKISARDVVSADSQVEKLLPALRKASDKHPLFAGRPIIVVYDPWTSLKSAAEAVGRTGVAEADEKEDAKAEDKKAKAAKAGRGGKVSGTKKDIGTIGNMGHAKHAHQMKRTLPGTMDAYNTIHIYCRHQNESVDMSGSFNPVKVQDKDNDTALGGEAIGQQAAYRMTMTRVGMETHATTKDLLSYTVMLHNFKNSYGNPRRSARFQLLFNNKHTETADRHAPALSWEHTTPDWMLTKGVGGIVCRDRLYTCEELGCTALPGPDLYRLAHTNSEFMRRVGRSLMIEGYDAVVENGGADGQATT